MRLPCLTISICLLAGTILTAHSHVSYAEVGSRIDADIPSYIARDSLSGRLAISVAEAMKPLVQGWANDLMSRYPALQIVVISERSHRSLAALLAQQTEVMAMSRRMTPTEVGNCLLEFGGKPIALPVAHHTPTILVRNDDSSAGTFLSRHVQARKSTLTMPHRNRDHGDIGFRLTGYDLPVEKPWVMTSSKSDGYVKPVTQGKVDQSDPLRKSVYLYIIKFPGANVPEASAELIRYALSRQGQQLALDLGYVPLSFEEVRRVTSRWSAS
jgi:ABC-type phosphate transport system substrate-binding protein